MEPFRDLILVSNFRSNIIDQIYVSPTQLTFRYSSNNSEVPDQLKLILVKIKQREHLFDIRFSFNHFEVSELLKKNLKLISFLNTFLIIGNLKYITNQGITYWVYTLNTLILSEPVNTIFLNLFEICVEHYQQLLIKIWDFYTTKNYSFNKKDFLSRNESCLDCSQGYLDCNCLLNPITQESEIKNSREIIDLLMNSDNIVEFFDFDFFDDEILSYLYNPGDLLTNRLKSFPLSQQFLDNFFRMLDAFKGLNLFFKRFPSDLIMVSVKDQKISDLKLALVFDQPYKYKRLFTNVYKESYKDDMRNSLAQLILQSTNSQITYEDYFVPAAFKTVELDKTEKIGSGKFSRVYKNALLSRTVAIKVPKKRRAAKSLMLNEFIKLKSLKHDNIVEILGLVVFNCRPCIVMPYYEKGLFSRNRIFFKETEFLIMMKSVALGLATIHKHKLVHQDLNPSNILLCKQKRPRIFNFGLAAKQGQKTITTEGNSIIYSEAGAEADILSFGMILYYGISRENPFNENWDIKVSEKNYKFIKVSGNKPTLTRGFWENKRRLAQLMTDCCEENPQNRPTALETAKRLDEILGLN